MDVLKGVYSKLKNNSNLATDAVPSSRLNENKDKDNHGPPPVPPRRKKNKSKTTTESNGSSESPQTSSTGPNQGKQYKIYQTQVVKSFNNCKFYLYFFSYRKCNKHCKF